MVVNPLGLLWEGPPRLLWMGQVASVAGDRLYRVTVVWFTVQLTGSAGAVADGRDGLRLARTVDRIRADVVALPALQASLPRLVERARLTPMVALLDSTDRLGRVLGPGAVGLLAVLVPRSTCSRWDSVSFLASALCLTFLVRTARPRPEPAVAMTGSRMSALTAGWRELAHRAELRHALILRGLCNLAWPAFTIGAPFVVAHRYHLGIGAYGLALGAFGAGLLARTHAAQRFVVVAAGALGLPVAAVLLATSVQT